MTSHDAQCLRLLSSALLPAATRGLAVGSSFLKKAHDVLLSLSLILLMSTPPVLLESTSLTPCCKCSFQVCQSHKSCEIDPVKLKDGENLENNMVRSSGLFIHTFQSQLPILSIFGTGHLRCSVSLLRFRTGWGPNLGNALQGCPLEAEVER